MSVSICMLPTLIFRTVASSIKFILAAASVPIGTFVNPPIKSKACVFSPSINGFLNPKPPFKATISVIAPFVVFPT